MKLRNTRGAPAVSLETALVQGLAPDGGLYVPETLPSFAPDDFQSVDAREVAIHYLTPFFAGTRLADSIAA
ncbi:MAG: threonine synthase, partial [Pseudomonadota bacterium]